MRVLLEAEARSDYTKGNCSLCPFSVSRLNDVLLDIFYICPVSTESIKLGDSASECPIIIKEDNLHSDENDRQVKRKKCSTLNTHRTPSQMRNERLKRIKKAMCKKNIYSGKCKEDCSSCRFNYKD